MSSATNLSLSNASLNVKTQINNDCKLFPDTDSTDVVISSNTASQPALKTPTSNQTTPIVGIKYAPVIAPVKGNYNLYAIAIQWLDNPGTDPKKVSGMGRSVGQIYHNLSNGNINFNVISKAVKVNYAYKGSNLNKAEAQAKKVVTANPPNTNPNLFIISNNGVQGFSHGSGNTAHLYGALTRDGLHEIGHCRPFVLQHSGVFESNGKYSQYADGTSFMSSRSTDKLTAVQLYLLGWLPEKKVAQHELTDPSFDYPVQALNLGNTGDSVKAVRIPRPGQKDLFLSMPSFQGKNTFALHQEVGNRGSGRFMLFSNTATYNNLTFTKISGDDNSAVIRISPAPATTPTPTKPTKK